ncbi:MAG: NAD(P)/FAD-dependent oxidoreductase [Chloroflexaceae bacterium]|nr:NAD(P)/FAD-dependent oxidoreductase [Chloroflexaceae bacterium]
MNDVIIIGGSFAGIAAALQLARARRQVVVVDSGTPRNRVADHAHGVLGHDARPPLELLADARTQLLRYPTVRFVQATAEQVVHHADTTFQVRISTGEQLRARRIILATGVRDVLPPVPGLAERWGVGVAHCPYCHGYEVAGQRLGVLATGEMAVHQAWMLPDWSDHVVLLTNARVVLTAEQRAACVQRGIDIVDGQVSSVRGPGRMIDSVVLADGRVIAIAALFVAPRTQLTSPLAEQLGCTLDTGPIGPFIRTDERQATTVPGVFAAGDAARTMHTITGAMADGAMAGVFAHQSLIRTMHPDPAATTLQA